MPKIIENLRDELLKEARKQVFERGYRNTTIRSVASECGVAVGTVYNYFRTKDMLIASFVLEDWIECTRYIESYPKNRSKDFLGFVYMSLRRFADRYTVLFSDKEAEKSFNAAFSKKHELLRTQLALLILPICDVDVFLAEYTAEALLTWTMAGRSFEQIYSLLPEKIKNKYIRSNKNEQL